MGEDTDDRRERSCDVHHAPVSPASVRAGRTHANRRPAGHSAGRRFFLGYYRKEATSTSGGRFGWYRVKGRKLMGAEIVAVGTELLLGGLVDTNTAWLSRRLAALGVAVYRHTTVGDNRKRLVAALSEAAALADLVVCTGGLGPTSDDLTHEALAQATGRKMVEYPQARRHMAETFERFTGRRPPPSAQKQALFPVGSELVANPGGTAMGALLELQGTLFATLPGVPSEMKRMFEETLEPLIGERSEGVIVSGLLRFAGISEEEMGEKVSDLLDSPDPTVATLVGPGEVGKGEVHLRLTSRASTREEANKKIAPVAEEILRRLSGYYLDRSEG